MLAPPPALHFDFEIFYYIVLLIDDSIEHALSLKICHDIHIVVVAPRAYACGLFSSAVALMLLRWLY